MSIAKTDLDFKPDPLLLRNYVQTRKAIIVCEGYTPVKVRYVETQHGFHFWWHIEEELTDEDLVVLQFLLGDDLRRTEYNILRLQAKVFNDFNCLFSKKIKKRTTGVRKFIFRLLAKVL
jgi:hypothetical protein